MVVVEANGHHDSGYVDDSNVNPLSAAGGTCPGPRDSLLPARTGAAGKVRCTPAQSQRRLPGIQGWGVCSGLASHTVWRLHLCGVPTFNGIDP